MKAPVMKCALHRLIDVSLSQQAMEALLATGEGNLVLADDLGAGLIDNLVGEWRLLYTSSNAMEYNQVSNELAVVAR